MTAPLAQNQQSSKCTKKQQIFYKTNVVLIPKIQEQALFLSIKICILSFVDNLMMLSPFGTQMPVGPGKQVHWQTVKTQMKCSISSGSTLFVKVKYM